MKFGTIRSTDEEFYQKFGIDPNETGKFPDEARSRVVKCAVLTVFGGKFDEEFMDELIGDAYAECFATPLDSSFSYRGQASFIFSAALKAAQRTLRKNGMCGGHTPDTINDVEIAAQDDWSYISSVATTDDGELAMQRYDDEDERAAINKIIAKLNFLPEERVVIQGLRDGMTLDAIGKELGVSRQRIKQRVVRIREKIQRGAPLWFQEIIAAIQINNKRRRSRERNKQHKG